MLWLKRNLMLIVVGVVALGLLGGAIAYLLAMMRAEQKAAADLKTTQEELVSLVSADPPLTDENIQRVNDYAAWLKEYTPQLQSLLTPDTNLVVDLDNVTFKSLLENTVASLNTNAASAGVTVKAKYGFTFDTQRTMVQFPANTIPLLTGQLYEIKELCEILIQSKVHSIEGLKRVRSYPEEPAGPDYLEGKGMVIKDGISVTPYEVTFRGFTAELSAVLDALQKSKAFFTVKRVTVLAIDVPVAPAAAPAPGPAGTPARKGSATTTAVPSVQTIMDEKPLRVTLSLEVVKQVPTPVAAAPAPAF